MAEVGLSYRRRERHVETQFELVELLGDGREIEGVDELGVGGSEEGFDALPGVGERRVGCVRMGSEGPGGVVVVDEGGGGVGSTVGRGSESGVGDVVVACGGEIVGCSRRVRVLVVDSAGSRRVGSTVLIGCWEGRKRREEVKWEREEGGGKEREGQFRSIEGEVDFLACPWALDSPIRCLSSWCGRP